MRAQKGKTVARVSIPVITNKRETKHAATPHCGKRAVSADFFSAITGMETRATILALLKI